RRLERVFRVDLRRQQVATDPPDERSVPADDGRKRLLLAGGEESAHQLFVRQLIEDERGGQDPGPLDGGRPQSVGHATLAVVTDKSPARANSYEQNGDVAVSVCGKR